MIQKTEIKFILNQGWGDFQVLWLIKYELGKAYNGFLKKGELTWEEVTPENEMRATELLTPFMRVPRFFPIQELVNALTDTKPAQAQIETMSELKATKYHLEDMRKIVLNKYEKETR